MGDDGGEYIPVRDNKNHVDDKDGFAQRAAQERRLVSKWNRDDLEDRYLRVYEENLLLKKHARKQEDKIKRMATKLLRLVSDKKKMEQNSGVKKVRDIETEEMLEELHGKIRELEKQNNQLREKLMVSKQQLATTAKRTTAYGHVQSRINTGIPKPPVDARIAKSMRVTGPPTGRMVTGSPQQMQPPRYGHSLLEETRAENRHFRTSPPRDRPSAPLPHLSDAREDVIEQLHEQVNIYEQDLEMLKEQMRIREAEYEEDLLKIKQQMSQGQRTAIQENIDIIRLQREVKEKATKLTAVSGQYANLEEKLRTVRASHDQVLAEMERVNNQLKEEQNKVLRLQNELKSGSGTQRRIVELQERVSDLERECEILKEANEKLVTSAFDLEREREWRQREGALKVQIAQLEATLKSDVGEKGSILDRLTAERDEHEKLEEEHKELRMQFYQLRSEHDDLKDKMNFFSKESAVDFQEVEEALMIVKKRKEKDNQELDFLVKVDEEKVGDYEKLVRELQAEHAESVNELEKTRNMLIVQHKINKDYQMEVEAVTNKMDSNRVEYETKLEEYAQLLDIRAGRIRKLEAQLRDVAYGTKQYRLRPGEEPDEDSDVEELDETLHLDRGQNLYEIHVKRVILSEDGLRALGDEEPSVFCTWEFYEYEIQSTPVMSGPKPEFQFTSQYLVKVDDFFLHYLQKDSTTLELHQSMGTDYRTIAACQLKMREILEKPSGRHHGSVALTGTTDNGVGICYGTVEYWVRLRVPMAQALRLYKERTKALGYISSNQLAATDALEAMDDTAAQRPPDNINEIQITVVRCHNLKGRREGVQPSPYAIYKFFDFDDHDTTIVTGSNEPQFNDHKTYPVPMTADLDKYLKAQPLMLYVFDDTDPDESYYIGVAQVPLIPLAHDKAIKGLFELKRSDGSVNGTVEINLRWKYTYLPPRSGTFTPAQEELLAKSRDTPDRLPLMRGEEEAMNSVVSSSPGFSSIPAPRPPLPRASNGAPSPGGPAAFSTPAPKLRARPPQPIQASPVKPHPPAQQPPQVFVNGMQEESEHDDSVVSEGTHVTGESEPLSSSTTPHQSPRAPPLEYQPDDSQDISYQEEEPTSVEEDSADMEKAKSVLLKAALKRRQNKVPVIEEEEPVTEEPEDVTASQTDTNMETTAEHDFESESALETTLEEYRPVPVPRRNFSHDLSGTQTLSFRTGGTLKGFLHKLSALNKGTMGLDDERHSLSISPQGLSKSRQDRRLRKSMEFTIPDIMGTLGGLRSEKDVKNKSRKGHRGRKEEADLSRTSSKISLEDKRPPRGKDKPESKPVKPPKRGRRGQGNVYDSAESLEDTLGAEQRTKSSDTMFGDSPSSNQDQDGTGDGDEEEISEEEDAAEEEEEEDSDGVVMGSSPVPRTGISAAEEDKVTVMISHLTLDGGTDVMDNPNIQMLFVEYQFLGCPLQETEAPFSLPKPKPGGQITFNFNKVFPVDLENNYEKRQYLASMLLPGDPDQGRVRFTVVSEPQDDTMESDCEDVGVAIVSIPDILAKGKDILDEDVPIYDIRDESTEIGTIRLTVKCLAALERVDEEMKAADMDDSREVDLE